MSSSETEARIRIFEFDSLNWEGHMKTTSWKLVQHFRMQKLES